MSKLEPHCSNTPVVSHDYQPKGHYITVAGIKCYTSSNAVHEQRTIVTKGIIALYDVYGFKPQTLQGADLVARLTGAVVLMPDFLGDSVPKEEIVTHTLETKKRLAEILAGPGKIENIVQVAQKVCDAAKVTHPDVVKWGIYGLCLGGKAALVAGRNETGEQVGISFAAVAQAHPGMLLAEDVQKCNVPILSLMSQKDGEPEVEEAFRKALKAKQDAEFDVYENMPHGWMGARGLNGSEESARAFEQGYERFGAFFNKHLV